MKVKRKLKFRLLVRVENLKIQIYICEDEVENYYVHRVVESNTFKWWLLKNHLKWLLCILIRTEQSFQKCRRYQEAENKVFRSTEEESRNY